MNIATLLCPISISTTVASFADACIFMSRDAFASLADGHGFMSRVSFEPFSASLPVCAQVVLPTDATTRLRGMRCARSELRIISTDDIS